MRSRCCLIPPVLIACYCVLQGCCLQSMERAAEGLAERIVNQIPSGSKVAVVGVVKARADTTVQEELTEDLRTAFGRRRARITVVPRREEELRELLRQATVQELDYFREHRQEFEWLEAEWMVVGKAFRTPLGFSKVHARAIHIYEGKEVSTSACFDSHWPLWPAVVLLAGLAVIWIAARIGCDWYLRWKMSRCVMLDWSNLEEGR